ncbi:hypothetical protein AT4G16024 [Arabidopsis thaliana]|uniref:Uncharacterized protein n=1 Tax=Arabidopsis thaliana TaxID=3702 RepID=B3H5G4_ARATH|nr:uncharacterized protein AT4G16024 [Arabidopsis thaliana]AEE83682.1 hypothetical protein AT4G16024 [Arabidopsis thaliana]|eukprot:NP_001118989.1 hypothetical protein AT4G16024 [Arabidopsis thaliana]
MAQNDRNTRIAQKAFEIVDNMYDITARRVISQFSYESTIVKPVVYHPTDRIQYFSGARPFIGHVDRFERPQERAINCDKAVQLYGGVLIKEFRN